MRDVVSRDVPVPGFEHVGERVCETFQASSERGSRRWLMPPKKVLLSTRERALFSRLIQEYENRKYKQALKTADAILEKVPTHGETVAIKGLVLFSIHQRDEGLALAKLGVRYDLTSFICWHALGIVYRMDRNYQESLKCYAQALRIEGGNLNLIRESGFMQLQMRNYQPFIDARLVILRTQPHLRPNWVALALAHDLADNKVQAVRVLAGFEDVYRDIPKHNYEYSEVVLYHASLLEQMGDAEGVLKLLNAQRDHIVDEPSACVLRVQALKSLGRKQEATDVCDSLLQWNAENKEWISMYLDVACPVKDSDESRLAILLQLKALFPKSAAIRRMILHLAQGSEFETHAREYLEHALVKNVPSLFLDVKSLYKQQGKQDVVEALVEEYRMLWDPHNPASAHEPPSSYLYAMYFLAHHYSYTGRTSRALHYIDAIIEHTPSMPELHMTRARVLKRAGAYEAAADAMEDARLLDGQDRYLNTKAAKYLLRVNKIAQAAQKLKLFTRPDVPEPLADLVDMQALSHLVEDAEAHERCGENAMALKRFHQMHKIVQDIYDDQLDFHSYCMRKMTLRAYVRTLRFEDCVFRHPAYIRAANDAAMLYAKLHDEPQLREAAEQKKGEETKKPAALNESIDELMAPPDPDPHGIALASTTTPLKDAHMFVTKLQTYAPNDQRTWLTTFEIALRERSWLLALRALSLAFRLDPSDPRLARQFAHFRQAIQSVDRLPDMVQKVLNGLKEEVPPLSIPLEHMYTEYVQHYGNNSALHALGSAELMYVLKGSAEATDVVELVFALFKRDDTSLFVLQAASEFLRRIEAETKNSLPPAMSRASFLSRAREQWPHADAFCPDEHKQQLAKTRYESRRTWLPEGV